MEVAAPSPKLAGCPASRILYSPPASYSRKRCATLLPPSSFGYYAFVFSPPMWVFDVYVFGKCSFAVRVYVRPPYLLGKQYFIGMMQCKCSQLLLKYVQGEEGNLLVLI
jgi:hypothetical protein